MSTVYLCSPTNSTMFTTCCQVAICDNEARCPRCNQAVTPEGSAARWRKAYTPVANGYRGYGNYQPNDRYSKP